MELLRVLTCSDTLFSVLFLILAFPANYLLSLSHFQMTILQLLSSSSLRMPLIIAVVMQLSQQLSGINAIFYYSTDVFIKAGLDKSVAKASTMAVGLTMVSNRTRANQKKQRQYSFTRIIWTKLLIKNKINTLLQVIMTIVSVPLMDRAGRRTLHLWGLGGMFLTSIFLTISLLVRVRPDRRLDQPWDRVFVITILKFKSTKTHLSLSTSLFIKAWA